MPKMSTCHRTLSDLRLSIGGSPSIGWCHRLLDAGDSGNSFDQRGALAGVVMPFLEAVRQRADFMARA